MSKTVARWGLLFSIVLLATSARAATLTRGPYLQLLTTTSVTVVWNTDTPAACALALHAPDDSVTPVTGPTATVCAIPLTGLTQGTAYGYTPLADGSPLDDETVFRTDDPTRPFAFLVVGDHGCACAPQLTLRDRMGRTPHDFLLSTGDMIYEDGLAEDYDPKFFGPYRELLRRVVLWPVLGNHDVRTAGGAPWRDAFYTPANNLARSENYYSFDYGNAHIAVIDSNTATSPGSAQSQFLDRDLAASTARWKFVAFHHSIYSSGAHKSNPAVRANLVPLFDRNGVDIVFMGHDHDYERTLALRANLPVAPDAGTVYLTTGGGGKSVTPIAQSPFTAHSEAVFHFTRVAIDGDVLHLQMIRDDGTVGDEMTLAKGGATPPPPACGDEMVNQVTEECDGADSAACSAGCQADCRCAPICGDGLQNQPSEACDGGDDGACPDHCRADCSCGAPVDFFTLAPTADTFIEAGIGATWDHGLSPVLAVDSKPASIAYLRFDLDGVTAPIVHAMLTLYCTNGAPDGGSIYPVSDSSWIEGDRTGIDVMSAEGPGLTWNDVDTNGDLKVDTLDTSPFVPDRRRLLAGPGSVVPGRAYAVDVTAAFQDGPGLYTLAMTSQSRDRAVYASRDSVDTSRRPTLRVQLGVATETTTTSSTTSTSSSTLTSTSTTTTTTAPPREIDVEPMADTYVENGLQSTWDHGASDHLDVDVEVVDITYMTFDLRNQPGTVLSATLTLFCTSTSPDGGSLYPVADSSWVEGTHAGRTSASSGGPGLTWDDVDTNRDALIDALDTSPFVPDFDSPLGSLGPVTLGQAATVDLPAAFRDGPGVYTFAIRNGSRNGATYSSRTHADPAQRPRLHLVVQ